MAVKENRENSGKECPNTHIDKERNSGKGFKEEITRKSDEDGCPIVEVHGTYKITGFPFKLQITCCAMGKHPEKGLK